jgi:hypothetical protein
MSAALTSEIFERHLDLRPLRGRRRGLVRCVFHRPDRRGSLSVDLDRGLFNCFTCGQQGGVKRFSALVGEGNSPAGGRILRPPRLSEHARAWRAVMGHEHAAEARRREAAPLWAVSKFIRRCDKVARTARGAATRLGPEDARAWRLLELAAQVEREGLTAEADLDAILAEGRVA